MAKGKAQRKKKLSKLARKRLAQQKLAKYANKWNIKMMSKTIAGTNFQQLAKHMEFREAGEDSTPCYECLAELDEHNFKVTVKVCKTELFEHHYKCEVIHFTCCHASAHLVCIATKLSKTRYCSAVCPNCRTKIPLHRQQKILKLNEQTKSIGLRK